jgi:hypothetical protein
LAGRSDIVGGCECAPACNLPNSLKPTAAAFPDDVAAIANITPEIAHEIRNQYVITYSPANQAADGTFRKIRVDVNSPGLKVHTRPGYYAPTQ